MIWINCSIIFSRYYKSQLLVNQTPMIWLWEIICLDWAILSFSFNYRQIQLHCFALLNKSYFVELMRHRCVHNPHQLYQAEYAPTVLQVGNVHSYIHTHTHAHAYICASRLSLMLAYIVLIYYQYPLPYIVRSCIIYNLIVIRTDWTTTVLILIGWP